MIKHLICILLAAVMFSGHSAEAGPKPLDISLVSAQMDRHGKSSTTALFMVRLQNAGPEAILVERAEHKVFVGGKLAGIGLATDALAVPKTSAATQSAVVYMRNPKTAAKVQSSIESRALDYRIDSILYVRLNNQSKAIKLHRKGHLDLRPPPQAAK